jgi:hypothetical protein
VKLLSGRLRRMAREAQNATGGMVHVLEETIACHKVVKVFSGQDYERRRFARASQLLRGFHMRQIIPEALTTPVTHMLAAVALSIIIYVAMHESLADRATVGEFASFLTAMLMLLAPLKRITEINAALQRGLAAAESVFGLIDTPVEEDRGTVALGRARGEVAYEKVSLTYPTRTEPALSDIDLEIRPGETVRPGRAAPAAARPRSSTCCRGFYTPTLGPRAARRARPAEPDARVPARQHRARQPGDRAVQRLDLRQHRLRRDERRSREDVIAAAEAAHAMSFIRELPEGLNTLIGESGLRCPGGQRQRLAIARALLKNAPLLILDEATSALDSESERQVQAALETLMRGRTTIVIAHRLSTIEGADRIVVLERGSIVEAGPSLGAARTGRRVRAALPHPVRSRPRRGMRIVHTEASLGWGGQEIRILFRGEGPDRARPRGRAALSCGSADLPGSARLEGAGGGASDRSEAARGRLRAGPMVQRKRLRRREHAQFHGFMADRVYAPLAAATFSDGAHAPHLGARAAERREPLALHARDHARRDDRRAPQAGAG